MINYALIKAALHEDPRGKLSFFNDLNLSEIERMYQIEPSNEKSIRAWQGHNVEQKWFYCIQGSFIINLVKTEDFAHPNIDAKVSKFILKASLPQVLHVQGGNASGIKSTMPNSKLLVFSDCSVAASKQDDFRFEPDFWKGDWEVSSK